MKEIIGDIWDFHKKGHPVVITTNGDINQRGLAVMGRGVALQAADTFINLRRELATKLAIQGNDVFFFPQYKIFTFPVKHHWHETADPILIGRSCAQLVLLAEHKKDIYLPRPGVGNGKLRWEAVRPILLRHLDDRFTVVRWSFLPFK